MCQKHDVVIIEDDAYYWLQFYSNAAGTRSPPLASQQQQNEAPGPVPGLNLPPSFLSMDTDGRVVRVDTLSKLMGPGYRIGFVSCAPKLAAKLAMAVQGTCVGPSSMSMVSLDEGAVIPC